MSQPTGTPPSNHPADDYWLQIADALRIAADRVATLAGTPAAEYVGLTISAGCVYRADPEREQQTEQAVARVNGVARAFATTTETTVEGRGQSRASEHVARTKVGQLRVTARATTPAPLTREQSRRELEEENARLRAKLEAQSGGAQ